MIAPRARRDPRHPAERMIGRGDGDQRHRTGRDALDLLDPDEQRPGKPDRGGAVEHHRGDRAQRLDV